MTSENMTTKPTIKTTLRLDGTFEPDVVTTELGLRPTRAWRKGDLRGGSPVLRHGDDGWALEINNRPSLHVDEELSAALDHLRPCAAQFKRLLREHGLRAQLCFGIDVEGGQYPSISFGASQIGELSDLGLSLDIDIV
jgi:Domain of unknown function (DUF4279)